jgi:MYXO-CTERM domain-containing protein
VLVCATFGLAQAQTVVFSGASAQASPGGGTHSALLVDGQVVVFFNDGNRIVYVSSPDGVTFSAPTPASDSPASLGFSVARRGNMLGLVWAYHDATGYSLWYREAIISAGTLAFGPSTLVSSHATDTRGYLATLSYSATGTPYIAALEYGQSYTGPIGPGCGSTTRYRPIHYTFQGSWQMRGYCNNFDTILDPNSISVAASGSNMIIASSIDANLSTAIVSHSAELGEPWHMVPAVEHVLAAQLSSVQSVTVATDVQMLYRDGAGTVSCGSQDGTSVGLNDLLLDVTVLNSTGRNPALSSPATATGCYVAAYTVGNNILRRSFKGTIASISPETTAFTTATTSSSLSIEVGADSPALVWQEGTDIKLGFLSGGPPPLLSAVPMTAPADGASKIQVSSTPFRDACGDPIAAGTLVTVTVSAGSIMNADASAAFPGIQVAADASGQIAVTLLAPTTSSPALVAAMPVTGGTNASIQVMFGTAIPVGCGDGILDTAGGEQCDTGGVDTATCNAMNCQSPTCGDGYVNAAASEDCEAGTYCDTTTCTFNFSLGGGCAGCTARGTTGGAPMATLMLVVFAFALRRRR